MTNQSLNDNCRGEEIGIHKFEVGVSKESAESTNVFA
jgi:hypothetical protein